MRPPGPAVVSVDPNLTQEQTDALIADLTEAQAEAQALADGPELDEEGNVVEDEPAAKGTQTALGAVKANRTEDTPAKSDRSAGSPVKKSDRSEPSAQTGNATESTAPKVDRPTGTSTGTPTGPTANPTRTGTTTDTSTGTSGPTGETGPGDTIVTDSTTHATTHPSKPTGV